MILDTSLRFATGVVLLSLHVHLKSWQCPIPTCEPVLKVCSTYLLQSFYPSSVLPFWWSSSTWNPLTLVVKVQFVWLGYRHFNPIPLKPPFHGGVLDPKFSIKYQTIKRGDHLTPLITNFFNYPHGLSTSGSEIVAVTE